MKNSNLFKASLIAAIYVSLCLILSPISFGPIQFRLSEILCLLAIDYPFAIVGVSLGCFIANLFFGGLGVIDVIFGTLATFLACTSGYYLRNKRVNGYPLLSFLMIILFNSIIVGMEFGFIYDNIKIIPISILEVGISELFVVIVGTPLYKKMKELIKKF